MIEFEWQSIFYSIYFHTFMINLGIEPICFNYFINGTPIYTNLFHISSWSRKFLHVCKHVAATFFATVFLNEIVTLKPFWWNPTQWWLWVQMLCNKDKKLVKHKIQYHQDCEVKLKILCPRDQNALLCGMILDNIRQCDIVI